MNFPLIVAGSLAVLGAAIHGIAGELLVVRKLSPTNLPSTAFGGRNMTAAMIHVTWHVATIAFLTVGTALILAGSVLDGESARAFAILAAVACTGFAGLAVGLGVGHTRSLRGFVEHPGPLVLTATAVLAWWGAL